MPKLIPTKKFLEDIEKFRSDEAMRKKIAKTMTFLGNNPLHPGLHIERITNRSCVTESGLSMHLRLYHFQKSAMLVC